MGIPNIHTTIDYAALIKAQSNQVIGRVPVDKQNYKQAIIDTGYYAKFDF